MTSNQIAYAKQREDARHNLQTEEVDRRNATVNERNAAVNERNAETNFLNYTEGARHNRETERIGYINAYASQSMAAAAHRQASAAERSNVIQSIATQGNLLATKYSNIQKDKDRQLAYDKLKVEAYNAESSRIGSLSGLATTALSGVFGFIGGKGSASKGKSKGKKKGSTKKK